MKQNSAKKPHSCDISDRLKILSLPNSHLVQAVLKNHSHVFTEDCRDRLRRLLQEIVTMNSNNKKKFEELNKKWKIGSIKDLKKRLKDIETKRLQEIESNDTSNNETSSVQLNNAAFIPNIPESDPDPNPSQDYLAITISKESPSKVYKPDYSAMQEFDTTFCRTEACYRVDKLADYISTPPEAAACGDYDAPDLKVLFQCLPSSPAMDENEKESPHECGDFKRDQKNQQQAREKTPNKAKPAPAQQPQSKSKRRARKRYLPSGGHKERTVRKPKRLINVPSVAVRAYIALIMDMQRNCALYQTFRDNMIKPLELYKEPYIDAAYACWLDYMSYVKTTLDYLHPYILNLVRTYYSCKKGDPKMREFETKLPKLLIISMKNIRPWRIALSETIECCRHIFDSGSNGTGEEDGVHRLYMRFYEKISGIEHLPYNYGNQKL